MPVRSPATRFEAMLARCRRRAARIAAGGLLCVHCGSLVLDHPRGRRSQWLSEPRLSRESAPRVPKAERAVHHARDSMMLTACIIAVARLPNDVQSRKDSCIGDLSSTNVVDVRCNFRLPSNGGGNEPAASRRDPHLQRYADTFPTLSRSAMANTQVRATIPWARLPTRIRLLSTSPTQSLHGESRLAGRRRDSQGYRASGVRQERQVLVLLTDWTVLTPAYRSRGPVNRSPKQWYRNPTPN